MATDNSQLWVITGASSGIGAAVTRTVTSSGARVLILDIDAAAGAGLASETGTPYFGANPST